MIIRGASRRKKVGNQITAANSEEGEGKTGRPRGNTPTNSRAIRAREWYWPQSLRKSQEKASKESSAINPQFLPSTMSLQY